MVWQLRFVSLAVFLCSFAAHATPGPKIWSYNSTIAPQFGSAAQACTAYCQTVNATQCTYSSTGGCTFRLPGNTSQTLDSAPVYWGCPSGASLAGSSCTYAATTRIPEKNVGDCPDCDKPGDAINSATGNGYLREADYTGVGAFPLRAWRFYNSSESGFYVGVAPNWGAQWHGYYDRSITLNDTNVAVAKRADGREYFFSQAGGAWVGDADVAGKLSETVDASGNPTGWTYTNERDELETYNASGQLLFVANRAGQVQALTYSDGTSGLNGGYVLDAMGNPTTTVLPAGLLIRVTDPAGRTLQFGFDAMNRTVKMLDPLNAPYRYTYDAANNLTAVNYPDSARSYLYGELANVSATPNPGVSYLHSLTGIVDELGNRYASWTYDAAGRGASYALGTPPSGISKISLAYTGPDASGNSSTSVTDSRVTTRTFSFTTLNSRATATTLTGAPCDGCAQAQAYDANGNLTARTDFVGNTTCRAYDPERNLETVRVEGLAPLVACPTNLGTYAPSTVPGSVERKITTQWHATYRLPLAVAEPLRITSYTYDAKGNMLTRSIQPTTDATGVAGFTATSAGMPRTWTYTYNTAGQVLTVDGPRTDVLDVTTYTYDLQGNLTSIKNALNQTTNLGPYDPNGRPASITDPNGLVTSFMYDVHGRVIGRSVGGENTGYGYDLAGNLVHVGLPSGMGYLYVYDAAHRVTQVSDPMNNKIVYTLDNSGNRTQEAVYNSAGLTVQTHGRVFDGLNHLVQDMGAANQTTSYTYDPNGNLLTVTDPLNRTTTNAYDALNRLRQVTNPDNGVIANTYDRLDQRIGVKDPKNLVTQYVRDGLGNLTQQASPDTGVTSFTYDAAGNMLTRTDAKAQVASYTYDALNRVTGINYGGGSQPITYQYDSGVNGIGHLGILNDATGTYTYTYDQHGRLVNEYLGNPIYMYNFVTGYTYDGMGRLASIAYPSGRTINYTFDPLGRIASIASVTGPNTQLLASNITYEPFGGVHSYVHGDGLTAPVQTYTRQRDTDGRIASYTLTGRPISVGYDAASQISFISDPANLANIASYTYDPMSRLASYTQGATSQSYTYDQDGNRISQTIGATTTSYAFGAMNNWLNAVTVGMGVPQIVSHDPNGARTADATRQYAYDPRGRLMSVNTAQGAANYQINGLGFRIRKQVPYAGVDMIYHYDAAGHLIGENNNGAQLYTREYVYLGDLPVAVMQ